MLQTTTEEGREPVIQDSRVNIGLVKPLSENFFVKLAYVRGNTSILVFHIKYMQANKNNARKKLDPYIPVEEC